MRKHKKGGHALIPISIKMQAFGPYKEKKFIDFERLNEKGLFLITGNTGSGKTTILDAMCVALYCRSTGGLRSFKELRNVSCSDKLDTEVEFIFMLEKKTYKFQRSLHVHNIKGKDKREIRDKHCCWEKKDDEWVLIESGAESRVRSVAQNIIGLDCEQFSKVIVLPQGEFRNLLLANSAEKSKIFTALFKTDIYQKITTKIQDLSDEFKLKIEQNLLIKNNIFLTNSVSSIEELKMKIEDTCNLLKRYKNEQKELSEQMKTLREKLEIEKTYESIKKEMDSKNIDLKTISDELKIAKEKFNKTKGYDKKIEKLKVEEKKYLKFDTDLKNNLHKAKKYSFLQEEKRKYQDLLEDILSKSDKLSEKIQFIKTSLDENKSKEDTLKKSSENLTNTFKEYQNLKKENEQFLRLEELKEKLNEAEKNYILIKEEYDANCFKIDILKQKKIEIEEKLFSEECIKIAERLIPNKPCPVCGSLEHPDAANKKNEEKVNLSDELKSISDLINLEEKNFARVKNDYDEKKVIFVSRQEAYGYQCDICKNIKLGKKKHQQYFMEIKKKLEDEEIAEKNLKEIKKINEDYEKKFEELKNSLDKYCDREDKIKKNIEILDAQQLLLSGNDFLDQKDIEEKLERNIEKLDACTKLQKELEMKSQESKMHLEVCYAKWENAKSDYKKLEESLKKILEKRKKCDIVSLKQCEDSLQDLIKRNDLLFESIGKLTQMKMELEKSNDQIKKLDEDKESIETKFSRVERLAQLLSGSNNLKIPIKIFVLGIMLDDVLCRANIYFSQFSNNRYSLSRASASVGRGYSGLDIDVFDSYYGAVRPVKTLSGGELFLASLSLAFGLSDAIQSYSGGIRLDSIFIDEGFGSLDLQTLETAIDAFSKVIKNGRIVGIISHVEELKNKIETKIQLD